MLSYFPDGVMPVRSHIANGADLNPDGHGYAIVTSGRQLIIRKSMDADELIEDFMHQRRDNLDGPALFHSRIATSGLVDITECHPFKVGSDSRTVVAHNGILFTPPAGSTRSDTHIFAEDMLPRMGSLDHNRGFRAVERFAGRGNKLVILTVNPLRRRNAYLVNAEAGCWVAGAWHSNYDYEGSWWTDCEPAGFQHGAGKTGKPTVIRYGKSVFRCEICGAYDAVSLGDGICEVCNSCNDCKMHITQCMCYVPVASRKPLPVITVGGWEHNS